MYATRVSVDDTIDADVAAGGVLGNYTISLIMLPKLSR